MDNLNTTHESFKLELENRHSEKVEELKKEYESSFSGKYFVFKYICYSTASHKKIFRLSDHYVHFTVLCGQLSLKTLAEFLPLELTSLILHTAVAMIPL